MIFHLIRKIICLKESLSWSGIQLKGRSNTPGMIMWERIFCFWWLYLNLASNGFWAIFQEHLINCIERVTKKINVCAFLKLPIKLGGWLTECFVLQECPKHCERWPYCQSRWTNKVKCRVGLFWYCLWCCVLILDFYGYREVRMERWSIYRMCIGQKNKQWKVFFFTYL